MVGWVSAVKPWEETWTAHPELSDPKGCRFWLVERADDREHRGGMLEADGEDRARLMAAAPDLYRALKAIEWIYDSRDSCEDNCPSCGAYGPISAKQTPRYVREYNAGTHKPHCALAAALAKARGETP